jgi:SM-20-related protein
LPTVVARMRLAPFELRALEIHALVYRDGDFFRVHRDTGPDNTRRMTFVYYVHTSPKRFSGGDLLLYDTYFHPGEHRPGSRQFDSNGRTRLSAIDNEIVFFPSEYYHEVAPVSDVGDDVRRARIAINGWFHTTKEEGNLRRLAETPY